MYIMYTYYIMLVIYIIYTNIIISKRRTYHGLEGSFGKIDKELCRLRCNSDCLKERVRMLARTLQLFAVPDTI